MSRSRRKHPICGFQADSEKESKQNANRAERRINRQILNKSEDADVLKKTKEVSDPWNMAKDGKIRFDPDEDPKSLRK
jgi:hypothetical protein